jgi:hypothetical protein
MLKTHAFGDAVIAPGGVPAIDGDCLSSYERCIGRCKKRSNGCDF